jgi:folate-dependent phosphoribosylglycinamide formyltransferase PurN
MDVKEEEQIHNKIEVHLEQEHITIHHIHQVEEVDIGVVVHQIDVQVGDQDILEQLEHIKMIILPLLLVHI